jgi:transposase
LGCHVKITNPEWEIIEPLLPEDKPVGRLREIDLREVLNAIYYRADNGVKWRNLPGDFPAWQTIYTYFRSWVRLGLWDQINLALVRKVRQSVGLNVIYFDTGHGETPQFKVDSVLTPIISVLLGINKFWRGGKILERW